MAKPKKTDFVITNDFSRGTVLTVIAALKLNTVWRVIIKPWSEAEGISDAQRRLYWMVLTDMQNTAANEMAGRTKDQWHLAMKRRFLMPIYEREFSDYAEMLEAVRRCGVEERKALLKWIASETSITRKCENDQSTGEKGDRKMIRIMREYLDVVMRYARSHGVVLRIDVRVFEEAMGYEYSERLAA